MKEKRERVYKKVTPLISGQETVCYRVQTCNSQLELKLKLLAVDSGLQPFAVCVLSVHISGLLTFNNRDRVKMCGSCTHDFIQYTILPVQSAISLG